MAPFLAQERMIAKSPRSLWSLVRVILANSAAENPDISARAGLVCVSGQPLRPNAPAEIITPSDSPLNILESTADVGAGVREDEAELGMRVVVVD